MTVGQEVGIALSLILAAVGESESLFRLFGLRVTDVVTTMWGIMILGTGLAWLASRNLKKVPETKIQAAAELVLSAFISLFESIFRDRERAIKYLPFLATIFIFILLSNYSGLLPGAGKIPGFLPPTAHWGVTLGLATVTFVATQIYGVLTNGLGYFKHFVEPLFLLPLILPLTIIEELVKPFSLSLRLFANIFGGEMVIFAILASIPWLLPVAILGLELILGFVQAFIFAVLSTVYVATATAHAHH